MRILVRFQFGKISKRISCGLAIVIFLGCAPVRSALYVDETSRSKTFRIGDVEISYTPILKVYSKRTHSIQIMGSIKNLLDQKTTVPVSLMHIVSSKDNYNEMIHVFCYDNTRRSFTGDSVGHNIEMAPNSKIYFNSHLHARHLGKRFWSIKKYAKYLASEPIVLCWNDFVSQGTFNYCDSLFYEGKHIDSSRDTSEFDTFPIDCGY